jgi:nucleoside-diphosphate-sugar epimerase
MSSTGALPARFRRQRLLIVGCGDIGLRVAALLAPRVRVLALSSSPQRFAALRAQGVVPLAGNLDHPQTLARLAGLGQRVLHLAPPRAQGGDDVRTAALLHALGTRQVPGALVYASTSGVYGDCAGAWVEETRATQPATPRAQRRVQAERRVRAWGLRSGVRTSVLRVPGIYAPDRVGGTPRERLLSATPVLRAQDDVYTSHIHADDLARACVAALWRGRAQRIYNVCDGHELKMGDYFDLAADLFALPRPPRVSLAEAQRLLSPERLSFMRESRRLRNARLTQELGLQLRYADVRAGLLANHNIAFQTSQLDTKVIG